MIRRNRPNQLIVEMLMSGRLEGRVAIVKEAGRGIGPRQHATLHDRFMAMRDSGVVASPARPE